MNSYIHAPNLRFYLMPEKSRLREDLILQRKHLFLCETGAFLLNRVNACFFGVLISKLIHIRGGP